MIDKDSKIFFACFFIAILASIALTYDAIYIRGDYETFTEENEPDPTDVYHAVWGTLLSRE